MHARDREILEHTLGGGSGRETRNHYAIEEDGGNDYVTIRGLVDAGLMFRGKEIPGGLVYYHATNAGREALAAARGEG